MKNMKKRISFLLVLVMLFALLAVPANAVTIDGNKAIVTDGEIDGAILVSALSDTVTVLCPEVAMVSAVEISAKALAKVEATGKKLLVATAFASVEINHKAISSIVGQIKESTGETKGVVSLALELKAEGKLNDAQAAALNKVAHQLYLNVDVLYEGKSLALGSGYIVAKLPQMLVGDMIEQYVVAYLDENGKFEVVDTDYVNGYLQAKLDQLGIYVLMLKSAVPADNPFVDVSESDWFYAPVLWAVENGITSGVDATHFGPNTTCNRAAVVTFLYAMKGKPEITAKSEFTDVADTDWFAKPVIWAVENKVTSGIGEGMFGPNNDCTRAAVVTFLKAAK